MAGKVRGKLPVPPGIRNIDSEYNTYIYYKRIPTDVRNLFDRYPELRHGDKHGFVRESLKTGDYNRVGPMRDLKAGEWERKWQEMRDYAANRGKPTVLTQITAPMAQELLQKAWVPWVHLGYITTRSPDEFLPWAMSVLPSIPPDAEFQFSAADWEAWHADIEYQRQYRSIETVDVPFVEREIVPMMARNMPGAQLDHEKVSAFRRTGQTPISLGELIDKFKNDTSFRSTTNRDGANANYQPTFNVMLDHFGANRLVNHIGKADITRIREIISTLPKGADKIKEETGEKFEKIAADAADAIEDGEDIERLSEGTLGKYFRNINSLFKYGADAGYIDHNLVMPVRVACRDEDEEEVAARKAISKDGLKAMFHADYRSPEMVNLWHPLICLYNGTRPNEAAQLDLDDVYHDGEVWVININRLGDGKRTKTKSSPRIIPIHQHLIDLGFLEFCERRRSAGAKKLLNVALAGSRTHQSFWESIRDGVTTILRDVGIYKPYHCVPHCLRHAWVHGLRMAHVPQELRRVLGGWTLGGGSAEALYGDKDDQGRVIQSPAAKLKPYLDRLTYDGLWAAPAPKIWRPEAYERVSAEYGAKQRALGPAAGATTPANDDAKPKASKAKPPKPKKLVLVPGKLKQRPE